MWLRITTLINYGVCPQPLYQEYTMYVDLGFQRHEYNIISHIDIVFSL